MTNYWYLSRNHEYPKPSWHVKSVQLNKYGSIIEMEREATENELFVFDFVYLGKGQWNDNHIQSKYESYKRGVK